MVMKCIMNTCGMRGGGAGEKQWAEAGVRLLPGYRMELDNARMTEMRC